MSFEAYGTSQSESTKPKIDYDAMNKYVVETADLRERSTLVGVVVGIVDLGTQEQPDAEVTFTGTPEQEEAEIEKSSNTYFKDGIDQQSRKQVRLKCWPQKPIQAVAVAVDFPDIVIDKGQFFGESNPQPLRLWLGGQFWNENKKVMTLARSTPLKVVNIDKAAPKPKWSFSPLHLFYKMALGAKLVNAGGIFLPQQIDQLLGKSFQFEASIFFKESKGKQYYNEYIKFAAPLARGQKAHEDVETFMLQFNKPNSPETLKQLRNHVINTIKMAKNYEGSAIQKQLEANKEIGEGSVGEGTDESTESPKTPIKVAQKVVKAPTPDIDDMGCPF